MNKDVIQIKTIHKVLIVLALIYFPEIQEILLDIILATVLAIFVTLIFILREACEEHINRKKKQYPLKK